MNWTPLKLSPFTPKDSIKKVKRKATDWKKIGQLSNKGGVSSIYRELSKLNSKKQTKKLPSNPIKTWTKDMKRHPNEAEITDGQ